MGTKVLVVDDDPIVGNLTRELLQDAGHEVELINDSHAAMEAVRSGRPTLAVLDILMPGIDGLTLCHQIKNDPELRDIKVAVVSGKAFHVDRQRAQQYGADLFIEKPYNVETFARSIADLLAGTAPARRPSPEPIPLTHAPDAAPDAKLHVTVWGCRSLSPIKGGEASRYGRATSCVSVEAGEELFIFDAGSGMAALGAEVLRAEKYKRLWLFVTHFHEDHIEGLAGFAPVRQAGFQINISGTNDPDKPLPARLEDIFESASPRLGPVAAEFELYSMREESYEVLPGIHLTSFYANHPGTTLGFGIETGGRRLIYCPDSELYGETGTALQDYDEKLGGLCKGADLLIHDGRYTPGDYLTRRNNGHSSWQAAVEFAERNEVKRLVLFHLDDQYSDAVLDGIAEDSRKLVAERGYKVQVELAREGLKLAV